MYSKRLARFEITAARACEVIDRVQPFAPDSPVEGTRFEPPVPPRAKTLGPLLEGIDQRRWVGPWIR
jgi:hypothetical protein